MPRLRGPRMSRSPTKAPLREVKRIFDIEGPRGGVIYVIVFACGHSEWRRTRRINATPLRPCMGCWVDARVAEQLKADDEAGSLIPPGFR